MTNIYAWSTTPSSNGNSDSGINFAEGQTPASLNDSSRTMMARVAAFLDDLGGVNTVGGTASAITVTLASNVASYANGLVLSFKASADNTGPTTISVNSIGAKTVRKFTSAGEQVLSPGDLKAGGRYVVQYDTAIDSGSGGWVLINPPIASIGANTITSAFLGLGSWTTVASASTVDLGAQTSRNLVISGTTTITSFGTTGSADFVPYLLRFSGALTLTHGSSLILPNAANITTVAGDVATVVYDGSNVWRVVDYQKATNSASTLAVGTSANNLVQLDSSARLPAVNGSLLTNLPAAMTRGTALVTTSGTAAAFTSIPANCRRIVLMFHDVSTSGTSTWLIQIGTSSGYTTTGYNSYGTLFGGSSVSGASFTAGFGINNANASRLLGGHVELVNLTGNTWTATGFLAETVGTNGFLVGGSVALGAALDRIRVTTSGGSDTFDSGTVNIIYEVAT